ncbi:MAG: hypothetical protein ACREU3_01135 [Steroidobacteraceae bacterium]
MQVIHFTAGASAPLEAFGARGIRFLPLAAGPTERDARLSCLHLAPGGRIDETPHLHDCALLTVQGRLTLWAEESGGRVDLFAGMGVVLSAGEPAHLESEEGAILLLVESPQLMATAPGLSTPTQIAGQRWPGEP